MKSELEQEIEQAVHDGLGQTGPEEILRLLDAELQQQAEVRALIFGGDPAPWMIGGVTAGGFGRVSERFIAFHSAGLRQVVLHDPAVRSTYAAIAPDAIRGRAAMLAPIVLAAIEHPALVSATTVAAIISFWLAHTGVDKWKIAL